MSRNELEFYTSVNHITLGDERSTSLLKGVAFGAISPGVNVVKTLRLSCTGAAGDRTIDISVQSRSTATPPEPASPTSPKSPTSASASLAVDRRETLRTLVVPALEPVKAQFDVVYLRSLRTQKGLADLSTFDADSWDDGDGGEALVTTTFVCAAESGIVVESIKSVRQVCGNNHNNNDRPSCLVSDRGWFRMANMPKWWIRRSIMMPRTSLQVCSCFRCLSFSSPF